MKNCQKISNKEIFVLDIFVHVFILLSVLTLFFVLVISKTERHGFKDQISDALKKTIAKNKPYSPAKKNASATVDNILDAVNDSDELYNQSLINYTLFSIGLIFVCTISIWLTMRFAAHKCPNLFRLILINILIFSIVGIIEYLFFTNYANDYCPVMPSYLINELNSQLGS